MEQIRILKCLGLVSLKSTGESMRRALTQKLTRTPN
jgi:hypothetical protein